MKPSSEALALGQALVDQLELDDRRDLLARWMANDIAVKMDAARQPGASAEAQQECADAIYALWSHRADLPKGQRPFDDLEKVAQLLRDLDPANGRPYYYRPTKAPGTEEDRWLEAALSFDQVARTLISYCLQKAAIGKGLKPDEWIQLAEAAGLEAPERLVVRIILQGAKDEAPESELHRQADRLKGLIRGVDLFRKASAAAAKEMRAELDALGPLPPRPKEKIPARRRVAKGRGERLNPSSA